MSEWTDFFVASSGAAAALAGLVIVAMSVNIKQILKYKQLPSRAGATIGMLLMILVSCIAGLIPNQSLTAFGIEILCFGIVGLLLQVNSGWKSIVSGKEFDRPLRESAGEALAGQLQVWPFIIAGVILSSNLNAGLHWLAGGIIAAFILSMMNAWILLVEILR